MKERQMETNLEREGAEILPANIGDLSARAAAPLLERAAARIEIVKPKKAFWRGMAENLRGATAYIQSEKSKAFRAIAGASLVATMVSACAGPVEGGYIPPTEISPTATLEAPPTQTLAPPPEVTDIYQGTSNPQEILAIPGTPEWFGGVGTTQKVSNSAEKQQTLNEQGYAPIVGGYGQLSWEISEEGTTLCAVNIRDNIYNPYVFGGEDLKIRTESGIVLFGNLSTGEVRTKVLSAVPISGFPESWSCVAAVVIDENNPAGLGAIRLLLIKQGSGEIMGEAPGAFAGEDDVKFEWAGETPRITVNGQELQFEMREGAVESIPEDRWQLSPDGRIAFNEAELYEGMFTVTEDSEIIQKYWEDFIRGLYDINVAARNYSLTSRYPTPEKFLQEAASGGLIENLWIPVQYPGGRSFDEASWTSIDPVDLSTIALSISKPTYQEIMKFSSASSPYYDFRGGIGGLLVERVEIDGRWILKFTLRRAMIYDDNGYNILALSDDYSDKHNLAAANQLIRTWLSVVGAPWKRIDDYSLPFLHNRKFPTPEEYLRMQDPEGALLKLR